MEKVQHEIFISYNWSIKNSVQKLYDILTSSLNYKVWLDEKELNAGNSPLTAELASAIKRSKVFISCITTDYCKSYNCNLEIEYASAKKAEMIVLMVENLNPVNIDEIQVTDRDHASGIGFIIGYIYIFC